MLMNKLSWSQLGDLFKKNLKTTNRYTAWRLASICTVGILGLVIIITIYFIYNNIYNTLSNSNAILILSSSPQSDTIDIEAYTQAKKTISKKEQTIIIPNDLRNIFIYGQTRPIPINSVTSTKK